VGSVGIDTRAVPILQKYSDIFKDISDDDANLVIDFSNSNTFIE